MNHRFRSLFSMILVVATMAVSAPALAAQGTPAAGPVCMVGVEVEHIGMGMPRDEEGRALVAGRLTIAPDGGFDAHTHPGMLTVYVDSGSLTFTQLDEGNMVLNRADGTTETMVPNEELVMGTGDWLVEDEGMVHTAWNTSDEPTVVILSGLIDPSLPLVQCSN